MSFECSTEVEGMLENITDQENEVCNCAIFQLFKSYEQSKEAVEKLRLQLYPTLFQANNKDGGGDFGDINSLEPIVEDAELSNELTEDTSEAVGESDDAIRGRNENDDDDDLDDDDDDDESVERTVGIYFRCRCCNCILRNFLLRECQTFFKKKMHLLPYYTATLCARFLESYTKV